MKIYNIAIPVIFAFFLMNTDSPNPNYENSSLENEKVEILTLEGSNALMKKTGYLNGDQNYTHCNTCADCSQACQGSEGGCAEFEIEVTSLFCPFESPQGTLSFPGNAQYICSITQTGPYTWLLDFNVIAYSCDNNSGFMWDIPMEYSYACNWNGGGTIYGTLSMLIC